ncbi:MAG: lactoylglutathione lyase [Limisphaerales bacterium]|jgi:lactoylglutathione lyase
MNSGRMSLKKPLKGIVLSLLLFVAPAFAERLSAIGIGVADLEVSSEFYQYILGLKVLRTYELGYLNEIVLGYEHGDGAVLVLMNWPEQDRQYDGGNSKIVFDVDDAAAVISRIRERGGVIDREALPIEAVKGAIIGLGRDPDQYVVEVIQR